MKNTKTYLNKSIISASLGAVLLFSGSSLVTTAQAQECDSCASLSNIENNTAQTANNTSFLGSLTSSMQGLLQTTTLAFFGQLPDLGNTMAQYTTIPAVQASAYQDQTALLNAIEQNYRGTSDEDGTLKTNYQAIFNNYLLSDDNSNTPLDPANTSASSLFLSPGQAGYYNDEQQAAAQTYIKLLSGAAISTQRAPSTSWLKNSSNNDKNNTRAAVAQYYTFNAMQSAIADSLAFVYSMNTGHNINGELDNYSESKISESGLIKYIQNNKVENEDWYTQLGSMSIGAVLKEQTILIAGAFLELTRIEELLKRQLVMQATQASAGLFTTQSLSQLMQKANNVQQP